MPATITAVTVDQVTVVYRDENGVVQTLNVDPTLVHAIAWTDNQIAGRPAVNRDPKLVYGMPAVPQTTPGATTLHTTDRSFCWYDGKQWHC